MEPRCRNYLIVTMIVALFGVLLVGCGAEGRNPDDQAAAEEVAQLVEEDRVPTIEFWITTQDYDPIRYEAGNLTADAWQELGFDVEVKAMEWATMSADGMKGHNHDAFMIQWGGRTSRIDPFHFLYTMHHSSNAVEGRYNVAGYENPEYDKLIDTFITSLDQETRLKAAYKAQEILAEDVPQPALAHRVVTHPYRADRFENVTVFMGQGLNNFWNWLSIAPLTDDGVVKHGMVNDNKLLNPMVTTTGVDHYVLEMVYDPLIRIGVDGKPVPWAAEDFEVVDDTTVNVTLRDGMSFHDGTPVTVEDVKYTYDLAIDVEAPAWISALEPLESVEVTGDRTLQFRLKESFAPFISNTLGVIKILPKHIWEPKFEADGAQGILEWDNPDVIGSGPFVFDYWRPSEELSLSRNDNHFNPPNVEGYLRIPFANSYGVIQSVKAGNIDVAGWSLLPLEMEDLQSVDGVEITEVDDLGAYILHYNLRHEPFDNKAVRRALTAAIPKDQIVNLVFEGRASPGYSVVAPVNQFWHNPDVEKLGSDPAQARQILEDAGFRWDEDGRLYYPDS